MCAAEQINERTTVEEGQIVMPFYLLCDASGSMIRDMRAVNEGVRKLWGAILTEPVVYEVAQICVMSFSQTVRVAAPMGQVSIESIPELSVHMDEGGTYYGAAFTGLADAIRQDVATLRAQGYKVFRPCAFFLTDGEPGDADWSKTFTAELTYDRATRTGMKQHPIFVPFGFREAREDVLRQLAYPRDRGTWYHARTSDVTSALNGILDIIMNTVINSANSARPTSTGTTNPALLQQAPTQGSQIDHGDSDYDPDYVWS